jgi:hypothetical protein
METPCIPSPIKSFAAFMMQYLLVELRDLCSTAPVVKLQHVVDEMDTLSDALYAYLNRKMYCGRRILY